MKPGVMVPELGVYYTPTPVYEIIMNLAIFALGLNQAQWIRIAAVIIAAPWLLYLLRHQQPANRIAHA